MSSAKTTRERSIEDMLGRGLTSEEKEKVEMYCQILESLQKERQSSDVA